MPTQLICDMGSCHQNKLGFAEEMLELCSLSKTWVKFQLCQEKNGNVPIDRSWLKFLVDQGRKKYGIEVFCSIWDASDIKTLIDAGCSYVKFAYSCRNQLDMQREALKQGLQVFVTHDLMENPLVLANVYRFWLVTASPGQPAYPYCYQVQHADMPHCWNGFSCHSYDPQEVKRAIDAGYKFVEFHAKLPGQVGDAPDFRFAINIAEVTAFSKINHGGR